MAAMAIDIEEEEPVCCICVSPTRRNQGLLICCEIARNEICNSCLTRCSITKTTCPGCRQEMPVVIVQAMNALNGIMQDDAHHDHHDHDEHHYDIRQDIPCWFEFGRNGSRLPGLGCLDRRCPYSHEEVYCRYNEYCNNPVCRFSHFNPDTGRRIDWYRNRM